MVWFPHSVGRIHSQVFLEVCMHHQSRADFVWSIRMLKGPLSGHVFSNSCSVHIANVLGLQLCICLCSFSSPQTKICREFCQEFQHRNSNTWGLGPSLSNELSSTQWRFYVLSYHFLLCFSFVIYLKSLVDHHLLFLNVYFHLLHHSFLKKVQNCCKTKTFRESFKVDAKLHSVLIGLEWSRVLLCTMWNCFDNCILEDTVVSSSWKRKILLAS